MGTLGRLLTMRIMKIYATEVVKHELTIELDDEALENLIEHVKKEKYQEVAEVYLDSQSVIDSDFEEDDIDIYIKDLSGKFVPIWTLEGLRVLYEAASATYNNDDVLTEHDTDSEFDADNVDVCIEQPDGKFKMLYPEDEDNKQ